MSRPRFIFSALVLVLLFHTHFPICNSLSSPLDLNLTVDDDVVTKRVCRKSIGECLYEAESSEMEMMMMMVDSETKRRVLAMQQQRRYISYETLKRDMVPCDRAGASYYNCHARQANPYSRGCEVITGCARGVQGTKT